MMIYPGAGYPGLYFPLISGGVSGGPTQGLYMRSVSARQPAMAATARQPTLTVSGRAPGLFNVEGD